MKEKKSSGFSLRRDKSSTRDLTIAINSYAERWKLTQ